MEPVDVKEAVALGIVGKPAHDGANEVRHHTGVHLTVAINLHNNIHAICQSCPVAGHDSAPYALVLRVAQHYHPRISTILLHPVSATVWTRIVNSIDARNFRPDCLDN